MIHNFSYDIGIFILKTPIDWDRYGSDPNSEKLLINTICLPKAETITFDAHFPNQWRNATVFGFGRLLNNVSPDVLQRGDLEVRYDDPLDSKLFRSKVTANETRTCKVIYSHFQFY